MNISVGIPNYNGLEGLHKLLPQIVKLNFRHIYLLDDNSSDDSLKFASGFSQLKIIKGEKNLGAGGNRNRILNNPIAGIIWFVDSDMILKTKTKLPFVKIIESFKNNKNIGVIGGQIFSKNEEPMFWNYGYEMHPERDGVIPVLEKLFFRFYDNKEVVDYLRIIAKNYFYNLEIKEGNNKRRDIDWTAEGNFFIRSSLFKKIKGFDANLRFHETQDLCRRIRGENKKIMFMSHVKTVHTELDVRGKSRSKEVEEAAKYFYKKHWKMPSEIFNALAKDHKDLLEKLKKI